MPVGSRLPSLVAALGARNRRFTTAVGIRRTGLRTGKGARRSRRRHQYRPNASHVEAHFENGASISVDALIGADGIHWAVRQALFGVEKPRFTGCLAHRGLVPSNRLTRLGLEPRIQIWMGPGRHFTHYFVSAGRLVNFVAICEEDTSLRESWVDPGEVSDVLAAYTGWHSQVLSIIGAADETYK